MFTEFWRQNKQPTENQTERKNGEDIIMWIPIKNLWGAFPSWIYKELKKKEKEKVQAGTIILGTLGVPNEVASECSSDGLFV